METDTNKEWVAPEPGRKIRITEMHPEDGHAGNLYWEDVCNREFVLKEDEYFFADDWEMGFAFIPGFRWEYADEASDAKSPPAVDEKTVSGPQKEEPFIETP